jgi:GT2 family glycosyltransferase
MENLLDLTIIIPNYNTRELLRECLESIYKYTTGIQFEVICVDDNSSDGSADMVEDSFPDAIVVRNTVGQMYAKNNNRGMRMSRARYACLLNSDTRIEANAFQTLVDFMDNHPDAAACTPKLLNPDGTIQSSIRRFPGLATLILQGINWHKLFPNGKVAREYYASDIDQNKEQLIQAVGSTALVIRRSTWETAGLLDERFPLFQVDLAYCYMLMKKGYKLYFVPAAEVIHYGSQSVNKAPKKSIYQMHKGFYDFNRHYDYFGKSNAVKALVDVAITLRYWLKLAEYHLSKDKRVIKGPSRMKLDDQAAPASRD